MSEDENVDEINGLFKNIAKVKPLIVMRMKIKMKMKIIFISGTASPLILVNRLDLSQEELVIYVR